MDATNFHLRLNITLVPGIWIATITEINYRGELRSEGAILSLNETHMKREGHFITIRGNTLYFFGYAEGSMNGVGILLPS